MRLEAGGKVPLLARWENWALLVWGAALVVVSARVLLYPGARSVYPAYAEAGRNWWAGQDLYCGIGGYRYPPPVTVLFAALGRLPDALGEMLWRLVGAGAFLGGLAWWGRAGLPRPLSVRRHGLLFLLAAPLSLSSLNNGQANLLLAGLLLLAVTATACRRWNLATCCLVLACLFKAYPVALALLLLLLYPRHLGWRLLLGLALGAALPFLLQEPGYVWQQYHGWLADLRSDDRSAWPLDISYRDMWLLCRLWHLPIDYRPGYLVVQLGAAALTAGLCLAGRWARWPARRQLWFLFGLGCCWMMLFGPATESSTYALFAAPLAWAVLDAWTGPRPWWVRAGATAGLLLVTSAFMAGWFPDSGRVHALGPHPLGALALYVTLAAQVLAGLGRADADEAGAELPPARAA